MSGLNGAGDTTKPRTVLSPQINCPGSNEHHVNGNGNENGHNLDNSSSTDISVTNLSDYMLSSKFYNDITNLKNCYSEIINKYDPSRNVDSTEGILLLTKDQIITGINKYKLKKDDIRDHLIVLLDNVRCICLPTYYVNETSTKSPPQEPTTVDNIVSSIEALSSNNKLNFDSIKQELDSLKNSIDNFRNVIPGTESECVSPYSDSLHNNPDSNTFNDGDVKRKILDLPPFDDCIDDFLDKDEIKELTDYFDGCTFTDENGHGTIKYGESYTYNGSRNASVEMPPIVGKLMSKLNEHHIGEGAPELNQCLVNKYVGANSFMSEHSDDERSIERDSSIFTISLGQIRTIHYRNVISGESRSLRPEPGSMYTMSRLSQEYIRHRIDKEEGADDVRYSLTFRSLSWRNHNRTILMGDSNARNIKFGNTVGTMGKSIPGKQTDAFTIDQLDPIKCIAFNNVVLHCGINNIKSKHINSDNDLRDLYQQFKCKVEDIRRVNKRCRILVSPILPTRLPGLNKRAMYYNNLLFNDLARSNLRVEFVYGYNDLLDGEGLLDAKLARFHDYLHLNASGVGFMARCIKNLIFIKKKHGDKQHSNKPRSSTEVGNKHRP